MARKDTLATPCILLRERLFGVEEKKGQVRGPGGCFLPVGPIRKAHLLFELLVHGQDGGVAHEGKRQDGNGVHGLRDGTKRSNAGP